MIEPEVKAAFCTDIDDIENWLPSGDEAINYWLQVDIGVEDEVGADYFQLRVASTDALIGTAPTICRATMLGDKADYSFDKVSESLDTVVRSCGRETWEETAIVLSRHFLWQYEDYTVIEAEPLPIEQARGLANERMLEMELALDEGALWTESRFEDGSLLASSKGGSTGSRKFIVLDNGDVHYEVDSLPPQWSVAKFSRLGADVTLEVINGGIKRIPTTEDDL